MKVTLITVGKIKEPYLQEGISLFTQRFRKKNELNLIEINDEKAPENLSLALMEQIKEKEGRGILNYITPQMFVITLEILGIESTTEKLSQLIEQQQHIGKKEICFVIGGSLGLGLEVSKRSNYKLSFSKMTLPHQLMKLILLEQLCLVLQ